MTGQHKVTRRTLTFLLSFLFLNRIRLIAFRRRCIFRSVETKGGERYRGMNLASRRIDSNLSHIKCEHLKYGESEGGLRLERSDPHGASRLSGTTVNLRLPSRLWTDLSPPCNEERQTVTHAKCG